MQTDPAACSTVGLKYSEVGERVSTVNRSNEPSLDLRAVAQPCTLSYIACSWGLLRSYLLPLSEGREFG